MKRDCYRSENKVDTAANVQKGGKEQRTAKAAQRKQAAEEERKKAIERAREMQRQIEEEKMRYIEIKRKKKEEQDIANCKVLLENSGMQFFIEYYPQVERLPIRDIDVSDHYLPEREVRLTAAKKIVDLGLTECALHYIIETYGDILSSEIIERAKSLLNEIKK